MTTDFTDDTDKVIPISVPLAFDERLNSFSVFQRILIR
jgi:hypothetical protein